MKKYNKQFVHKGYTFNISVELNTSVEKRINGRVWHTVITNCLGGNNYYERVEVESLELEVTIDRHQQLAIDYIDKITYKPQTVEEMLLSKMGFS